jgi:ketosteroid isomerase-like protein
MSQENVDVVVKQFQDTNARDFASVMVAYAEDVTLELHGEVGPLVSTAAGKAAVGEWFGDWFRQFGRDYRFDIEESRGVGDRVFILASHHGRGRGSGVPVEERWAYVYTVREGKVSRLELWNDRDARERALAAIGLPE